jgi:hypothetical protein
MRISLRKKNVQFAEFKCRLYNYKFKLLKSQGTVVKTFELFSLDLGQDSLSSHLFSRVLEFCAGNTMQLSMPVINRTNNKCVNAIC